LWLVIVPAYKPSPESTGELPRTHKTDDSSADPEYRHFRVALHVFVAYERAPRTTRMVIRGHAIGVSVGGVLRVPPLLMLGTFFLFPDSFDSAGDLAVI